MKQKKQLQTEALARRELNVAAYKGGNIVVPEGVDKADYVGNKLKIAERDVEVLRGKLGIK